MVYHLYFHNDFDGRASAAILLAFFRSRGDSIAGFHPMDFHLKPRWARFKFKQPAIIVDFIYHPKAEWWFDHHQTSFIRSSWQKKFRQDKFHKWNSKYPSCTSLVLDSLKKDFGLKPPAHLKELAKWLDVIDAARFRSARQAVEFKEPALKLMNFIDTAGRKGDSLAWLIDLMSRFPLSRIVRDKRLQQSVRKLSKDKERALVFYKKNLRVYRRVSLIDLGTTNFIDFRFATYYLKPKLLYNIIVKEIKDGFKFSVGSNPWRRKEIKANIAKMLEKYGGGGHRLVGGVTIKKDEKLKEKIIEGVITALNRINEK